MMATLPAVSLPRLSKDLGFAAALRNLPAVIRAALSDYELDDPALLEACPCSSLELLGLGQAPAEMKLHDEDTTKTPEVPEAHEATTAGVALDTGIFLCVVWIGCHLFPIFFLPAQAFVPLFPLLHLFRSFRPTSCWVTQARLLPVQGRSGGRKESFQDRRMSWGFVLVLALCGMHTQ